MNRRALLASVCAAVASVYAPAIEPQREKWGWLLIEEVSSPGIGGGLQSHMMYGKLVRAPGSVTWADLDALHNELSR